MSSEVAWAVKRVHPTGATDWYLGNGVWTCNWYMRTISVERPVMSLPEFVRWKAKLVRITRVVEPKQPVFKVGDLVYIDEPSYAFGDRCGRVMLVHLPLGSNEWVARVETASGHHEWRFSELSHAPKPEPGRR